MQATSQATRADWSLPEVALADRSRDRGGRCARTLGSGVNYGGSLFTKGNLQGETLGVVAFRVDAVTTRKGKLPQARITILGTETCGDWRLLNAPVPKSSSVPNDRTAPGSTAGYKREFTWPGQSLFF